MGFLRAVGALMLVFSLLYLPPLWFRPMLVPDEFRYAEIPREMGARGDWVVPRLNGVRYFEKPVLGYWLTGGAFSLLGEGRAAGRLPSALAALGSALCLLWVAGRFGSGFVAGLGAGLLFLLSPLVFVMGTTLSLDGVFTFFLTWAFAMFFAASRAESGGGRDGLLLLCGVGSGLAFMVKGPVAFALLGLAALFHVLLDARARRLIRRAWIPLSGLLLVSLPWAVAVHVREPRFWPDFIWIEHVQRYLSPLSGQHPEPIWYFVPILVGAILPWISLFPAVWVGLRVSWGREPLLRFCLVWFGVPFLFLSASKGKLPTYILPCIAPLALLVAEGVRAAWEKGAGRGLEKGMKFFSPLPVAAALALAGGWILREGALHLYGPGESFQMGIVITLLLLWALLLLRASRARKGAHKVILFLVGPGLLFLGSSFLLPQSILEERGPGAFLVRQKNRVNSSSLLVSTPHLFHAVCWVFGRDDVRLLENPGELKRSLARPGAPPRRLTLKELQQLVEKQASSRPVVLVLDREDWKQYKGLLPPPTWLHQEGAWIMACYPAIE